MRWLRVIAVLLLVALLQVTILPALTIGRVHPDLLFLTAVCIVARKPQDRARWRWNAFWIGWAAGLLEDIYSAGAFVPFGWTALVFGLTAIAVGRVGSELFLDSTISQVLVLLPVCVAAFAVLAVTQAVAAGSAFGVLLAQALWMACYSALVAPLVFAALRPLARFLGLRARRSFGRA